MSKNLIEVNCIKENKQGGSSGIIALKTIKKDSQEVLLYL